MTTDAEPRIYWIDKTEFVHRAKGGIFYRSDLGQFIQRVEEKTGKQVNAIRIEPDTDNPKQYSWNIEILIED